jgi:hypothetical protein
MMTSLRVIAAVCVICLHPAHADEGTTEPESFIQTVPGIFLMAEGMLAVNAGLATLDPQVYGLGGPC